jgi:hypothetical protein
MARPRVFRDPEVVGLVEEWLSEGRKPGQILPDLAGLEPPVLASSETLRRFTQSWRNRVRTGSDGRADAVAVPAVARPRSAFEAFMETLAPSCGSCGQPMVRHALECLRCGASPSTVGRDL